MGRGVGSGSRWSPTVCDGVLRGGNGSVGCAAPGVLAGRLSARRGPGVSEAVGAREVRACPLFPVACGAEIKGAGGGISAKRALRC